MHTRQLNCRCGNWQVPAAQPVKAAGNSGIDESEENIKRGRK